MRDFHLLIAELVDAYRVVPRIVLIGYGYLLWDTHVWYSALPDPTTTQTAYATLLWGACTVITAWYINTGRKWTS